MCEFEKKCKIFAQDRDFCNRQIMVVDEFEDQDEPPRLLSTLEFCQEQKVIKVLMSDKYSTPLTRENFVDAQR